MQLLCILSLTGPFLHLTHSLIFSHGHRSHIPQHCGAVLIPTSRQLQALHFLCSGTSVKRARETEGFDFDMIPLCSLLESSGDTCDDADQQAYCWYSPHWDAVAVLEATLEEGDFSLMRDWFASCRSRCSLAARGTRAADPLIHWWHTCQEDTKCQMHEFLTALSNT